MSTKTAKKNVADNVPFAQIGTGGYEPSSEWARLTIVRGKNSREKGGQEALGRHKGAGARSPEDLVGKRFVFFVSI